LFDPDFAEQIREPLAGVYAELRRHGAAAMMKRFATGRMVNG
jgi:hypothetical protein